MIIERYFKNIVIIGVGLLGGSIGLALKQRSFKGNVTGIGKDEKKLIRAQSIGIIDKYSISMQTEVRNADLIIICTPINSIAEIYKNIYPFLQAETIVTDVGSTKHELLKKISMIEKLLRKS